MKIISRKNLQLLVWERQNSNFCKNNGIWALSTRHALIILLFCVGNGSTLLAQRPIDTLFNPIDSLFPDTLSLPLDSLGANSSIFQRDSSRQILGGVKLSDNALDTEIEYLAQDSMIYDIQNQKVYLYGKAVVNYTTIKLEADFIEFDWTTNTVRATGLRDSIGRLRGKPVFADGEQKFQATEMRYNFVSGKGVVSEATTTQNNLYVRGEKSKFFSAQGDTTKNDLVYSYNAIFTTCDHEEPHFGIRSRRQKVIPNKLVVVGPSNLEVMGVPTPLWLPFGFFPISQGKSTGLLFPRNYEYSQNWGFGLQNVGWYFPLGDYVNLQLTGDIYLKGSYRLRAITNYTKRYKYRGSARFEYHSLRNENALGNYERSSSFILRLNHNQDAKAHPSRTVGGNINIQTNNALSQNYNDPNSVLSTDLNSNFSYRESFPNRDYNLSLAFSHSQNNQSGNITINFPTFNFQTKTLYPFKNKKGGSGDPKFYEKIALTYRGEAKATVTTTDSTLFQQETLDEIQFGARHNVASNASFKLFQYINVNPSVNYDEVWFFKTLQKEFDPTIEVITETQTDPDTGESIEVPVDTIFGQVLDSLVFGWSPLRKFNSSLSLDTKLFGTLLFKKGPVRGLRHILTPRVGLSFTPDYTNPRWGYFEEVQQSLENPDDLLQYNIFETGLYSGDRPSAGGQQFLVTYGLSNIFEAKLYNKRDSTERNIRLLRRLDINGSYNVAADSLQWSTVSVASNANFFNNIVNVVFNADFDPYEQTESGRRINTLVWETQRRPVRFDNARLSVTTALTVRKIQELIKGIGKDGEAPPPPRSGPNKAIPQGDPIISLFDDFSIRHNLVFSAEVDTSFISANVVSFSGRIPLTPKWDINVSSFGYDFSKKSITYPAFSISRDLHCWEMAIGWQPQRGTYSFSLRVDQGSMLDFLKIPYQKGVQDIGGFSGF